MVYYFKFKKLKNPFVFTLMLIKKGENMVSVKTYYIRGTYKKGNKNIVFGKYIRAISKEHALEELYSILGSKHRVKRNLIFIDPKGIQEVTNIDSIKDQTIKIFASDDNLQIPLKK